MLVTRTVSDTRAALRRLRAGAFAEAKVALVPTMGALHAGHLSLVAAAREAARIVVASIFVNPLQFSPTEDLDRYPRPFAADCNLLEEAGVDMLFAPGVEDIYPRGRELTTIVEVPGLSSRLDGASRPGHFTGVATVVAKLFNIVQPELAFFGQKDAAQVAVLRRMVADLDLHVELRVCATVREVDGLAMSSRNRYLSPRERETALALSRALRSAEAAVIAAPEMAPAGIEEQLRAQLLGVPGLKLDYAAVVSPNTLEPVHDLAGGALVAVAAWVGTTRLIDNVLLPPRPTFASAETSQAETVHV